MKGSIYDINKIIDNKFDKDDLIHRNKISKSQQIEFSDSEYLMNKLNNDKKEKEWRILGIYPKDIIGLDEIVDGNNNYYLSAKCTNYNSEIYEIYYKKFNDMVTEDNVKNIFIEYSKNKMTFLAKRLKELRTLYINEKFETYANYLKKYYLDDDNKLCRKIIVNKKEEKNLNLNSRFIELIRLIIGYFIYQKH